MMRPMTPIHDQAMTLLADESTLNLDASLKAAQRTTLTNDSNFVHLAQIHQPVYTF